MKKTKILTVLVGLAICSMPVLASFSTNNDPEAEAVFSAIQEIRYVVEADANYSDYNSAVTKASIAYARYKDKHGDSFDTMAMHKMLGPYQDAKTVWQYCISTGDSFYPDLTKTFSSEYNIPIIFSSKSSDGLDSPTAMQCMFNEAKFQEDTYNSK